MGPDERRGIALEKIEGILVSEKVDAALISGKDPRIPLDISIQSGLGNRAESFIDDGIRIGVRIKGPLVLGIGKPVLKTFVDSRVGWGPPLPLSLDQGNGIKSRQNNNRGRNRDRRAATLTGGAAFTGCLATTGTVACLSFGAWQSWWISTFWLTGMLAIAIVSNPRPTADSIPSE